MTLWLWLLGSLYVGGLVYATIRSRRRMQSADDYILAGSNVGLVLGFLTYAATVFSTFTLLGMPDFFRTHGVGAWIFIAVSNGGQIFMIVALGLYLRRRVAQQGFNGVAGLLSSCYGKRIGGYVYLVGAFLFLIPYVAIQIRGVGIFLDAALPGTLPMWAWASGIVVIMLVYSEIGGLRAIIYSDAIQGILLFVVTWIIAFACVDFFGGVAPMFAEVERVNTPLLSTPGPNGLFSVQFLVASFLAICMYPITQPQVTVRIIIMRDGHSTRRMAVAVGLFAMFILMATIPIGMYGAVRYPDLPVSEFLAQVLLFDQAPIIGAAVTVGLIAAAMSTADSQIFALGAELRSMLRASERRMMIYTRLAIVVFALAALIFALLSGDQLVLLARVSFAGTALLGPLVLLAILFPYPKGIEVPVATALAVAVFAASSVGMIPSEFFGVRLDLILLVGLGAFGGVSAFVRRRRVYLNEATNPSPANPE